VIDPQDLDLSLTFVELVDDAVWPSAGSPQPLEETAKGMAEALRSLREGAQHELDDGSRCLLGETGQSPLCRRSHDQLPPLRAQPLRR
jgi:hypothetical protein